jgi:hypothetical protein
VKKLGVSPDSFIQMALQLAYFRDQKKFGLTYEASMVRFFKHGRTETIRSLSEDSVAFVRCTRVQFELLSPLAQVDPSDNAAQFSEKSLPV